MFVGVSRLTFHLHGNASLKGKRSIVRRLVDRTRAKFNVSAAEVGDNDVLQRAVIGMTVVGNSASHVDSMLGSVVSFVENIGVAVLVSRETEIIPLGSNLGEPMMESENDESQFDEEGFEEW